MRYRDVADELVRSLELDLPPVALSFVQEPPAGVRAFEGVVPSACTFWRKAEEGTFYAAAEDHFNCLIGAMTMGFDIPEEGKAELMGLVESMCAAGYIAANEPENIPSVVEHKSGIVYGPLAEFPLEPDLVVTWLSPRQAMLYNEAVGNASWATQPGEVFGRPACGALPMAHNEARMTLSLGCMGMRTFTGIPEDRMLAVLPGRHLGEIRDALRRTMSSNETMRAFYEDQRAKLSG